MAAGRLEVSQEQRLRKMPLVSGDPLAESWGEVASVPLGVPRASVRAVGERHPAQEGRDLSRGEELLARPCRGRAETSVP